MDYLPHGRYCLAHDPGLVALHSISDAVIAGSYFLIAGVLLHGMFTLRRAVAAEIEVAVHRLRGFAWLFGAFILLCGLTHIGSLAEMYSPRWYWQTGVVKALCAGVSLASAYSVWAYRGLLRWRN